MISSPEDVVNLALTRIGYKTRVQSLFEGSPASDAMLNIYGQTRDDLLREGEWDFAKRSASLTLINAAPQGGYIPPNVWTPAYPPPPWAFLYGYPSDAIRIDAVRPPPVFIVDPDPQPIVFRIANANNAKVILCNQSNALAIYTARVTDPTQMEPAFIEALAAALAKRAAAVLLGGKEPKNLEADEAQADALATGEQG